MLSDEHLDAMANALENPELVGLPIGKVIATAELVECWKIEKTWQGTRQEGRIIEISRVGSTDAILGARLYGSDREYLFGDWTPGRYAWELRDVTLLPEPLPYKGFQRLWDIPDEVIEAAMKKPTLEVDECPR